jgi:DNA-binding transcriptional ArsR family regulator
MSPFLSIARALGDEGRVRALMALRGGELCLCQIIELLALAPSTVSRHLNLLVQAGLVRRRKDGRWMYYRLPGREAPPEVRQALKWVINCIEGDPAIAADAKRLRSLRRENLKALCACYTS